MIAYEVRKGTCRQVMAADGFATIQLVLAALSVVCGVAAVTLTLVTL